MAEALHPPHVSQGLGKGVSQADAHVLHRVVVVHPGVPFAGDRQTEAPVAGKAAEHVVKKAHAGVDIRRAAVQAQVQGDLGLPGGSGNPGRSHSKPSSFMMAFTWVKKASISSSVPTVTRLYWAMRGSEKWRIRTPRSFSFW